MLFQENRFNAISDYTQFMIYKIILILHMVKNTIKIKRVYDQQTPEDGFRILVDRLWPRGLNKKEAKIDLWLKDIAPSNDLRKWFNHDLSKWEEFQKLYKNELFHQKEILNNFKLLLKEKQTTTLLFAALDKNHNNAIALKKILSLK